MNHMRTRQSGSTTSFLLVGVAFIILVVGGIYVLRSREDGNTTKPSPATSSSSPSVAKKTTPKGASTNPKSTQSPLKSGTKTPSTKKQSSSTVPLPTTGPSEDLSVAMIFAILTAAAVSYVQSYKVRAELLRR
ncbi:MAG: hypothetical protein H6797_05035 [Candidatus Nomurabacteria bacterium]|nr:MAG: hypothetical protein H6797_05035 [Candidatus Nomurabacteria bacterium]